MARAGELLVKSTIAQCPAPPAHHAEIALDCSKFDHCLKPNKQSGLAFLFPSAAQGTECTEGADLDMRTEDYKVTSKKVQYITVQGNVQGNKATNWVSLSHSCLLVMGGASCMCLSRQNRHRHGADTLMPACSSQFWLGLVRYLKTCLRIPVELLCS